MIEHDDTIGTLLKALDDLGIANDTIVVYSTDNGPHMNTWPDGAMTPFRSREEHQLGRRVPRAVPRPLARQHQAGHDHQRADEPQRLDSDALRHRRRAGHRRQVPRRATTANGNDLQGPSRRLRPEQVPHDRRRHGRQEQRRQERPRHASSTPTTTACSSACAWATTR